MATPVIIHATPVIRQQNPVGTGFVVASRWVDVVAISGTAAPYTVPVGSSLLRLTPSPAAALPAYGNLNGTAVVPAATLTGTGSFPITSGTMVSVRPGDVLSMVGSGAGFMSIEVWS